MNNNKRQAMSSLITHVSCQIHGCALLHDHGATKALLDAIEKLIATSRKHPHEVNADYWDGRVSALCEVQTLLAQQPVPDSKATSSEARANLTGSGMDSRYIANQDKALADIEVLVPLEYRESAAYHRGFEAGARWKARHLAQAMARVEQAAREAQKEEDAKKIVQLCKALELARDEMREMILAQQYGNPPRNPFLTKAAYEVANIALAEARR